MKINEIPIVLHTMDSYHHYWDNWYNLFKKYVKNHGPIYFLSEEKEPSFVNDVVHIKTGSEEWGYRLLKGLESIDSDLIFYMQEDFWAVKDIELTDSYLDMFKDYNMDCLKICLNSSLISLESINDTLYKYTQNSKYTLSHQFALWNKEFLMKNVYPFESPWQNEIYGSDRINESEHNIYYIDNNWYEPVCRQGTLQPIGYEILKKHNLSFYGK
jgi:hypothetical protein